MGPVGVGKQAAQLTILWTNQNEVHIGFVAQAGAGHEHREHPTGVGPGRAREIERQLLESLIRGCLVYRSQQKSERALVQLARDAYSASLTSDLGTAGMHFRTNR